MFRVIATNEVSNRADFSQTCELVNGDGPIDAAIADDIVVAIDSNIGCRMLLASLDNGKVVVGDTGQFTFSFARSEMETLNAGTYQMGCTITINDITTQVFTGEMSVVDGIVPR